MSKTDKQKTPKISTDPDLIAKFLDRGVDSVLPTREGLEAKLKSGDRITAYMGFDPTGPYLHVGHAMGIRALRILQQLGHRVIFLVGDYTARVGDPDKGSTRELLTAEKIASNMAGWREQAGQLIDFEDSENPVEFLHNYDWLHKLQLADLIDLMSKTTVQQMLERDLFARRIEEGNPIQLQEFIYPLMQGYDSVAMEVDLELGGTDQIFNMMVGRDLVKSYLGKEKFVRAQEMMPAPNGITMSKTRGNGINLADSAEDMYGKAMSYPDDHITTGMKLLTDLTDNEISEIEVEIAGGANPMQFKKMLAREIVRVVKGDAAAQKGQEHFEQTVQGGEASTNRQKISLAKLTASLERQGKQGEAIALVSELQQSSRKQAKQLLGQNGVEINGDKLDLGSDISGVEIGDLIKIGKRDWYEIVN